MVNLSSSLAEVGIKVDCCGSQVTVRLEGLVRKLQREPDMIDKYDEITQEQLKEGIVERVVEEPNETVLYILHKPVKGKQQQPNRTL